MQKTFRVMYVLAVGLLFAWLLGTADLRLLTDLGWLKHPAPYLLALGWVCMVLLLGFAWACILYSLSGVWLPSRVWVAAQLSAWSGRYLPGKLGLLMGKWFIAQRPGLSRRIVTATVLIEQLAFVGSGLLVMMLSPVPFALLSSALADVALPPYLLTLTAAALLCVAFGTAVFFRHRWVQVAQACTSGVKFGALVVALAGYLGAHVIAGLALHPMILLLASEPVAWTIWNTIGALAAAHAIGALAIFAPAGVGVREGILVLALSPALSPEHALWLAVVVRVITLITDAGLYVAGIVYSKLGGRDLAEQATGGT